MVFKVTLVCGLHCINATRMEPLNPRSYLNVKIKKLKDRPVFPSISFSEINSSWIQMEKYN